VSLKPILARSEIMAGGILLLFFFLIATPAAHAEPVDQAKIAALKEEFDKLKKAGRYQQALTTAEEWQKLAETFGPDSTENLDAVHDLSNMYVQMDVPGKGRQLCERALAACEKKFGPDDPMTARAAEDLGSCYEGDKEYAKGEPLFRRALEIYEKKLGAEAFETGEALRLLAWLKDEAGDLPGALPLAERALKIYEKTRGPSDVETSRAVNVLSELYNEGGNTKKGIEFSERALAIREKELGPDHPDTGEAVNNRGLLYFAEGDYDNAIKMFARCLAISETALGPDHFYTTSSLNNLGFVYRTKGEFPLAEKYFRRALESRERMLGPKDPNLALSLNNLASLLQDKGDTVAAEAFYQRALQVREEGLGPEHPDTARSLNDLAGIYLLVADFAKAEPLFQQAIKIFEKNFGPDHEETLSAVNNLALLYEMSHQYEKAVPLFERALKTKERTLGPDSIDLAFVASNLGVVYWDLGDYDKAETYARRALKLREAAFGPRHPKTAESLSNVGVVLRDRGELEKAEPFFQRALQIEEENLGKFYPPIASTFENLAFLKIKQGKPAEALKFAARFNEVQEHNLADVLSFTSERQRLAFQKYSSPYRLFATLGSADNLARTVLRQKGVVLDSLLEDQVIGDASADPKNRELVQKIRAAKEQLTQLTLQIPADPKAAEAAKTSREKLSGDVERLEATLARAVTGAGRSRRALSVTVGQVQAVLPKASALVELLRYPHYTGGKEDEMRYGAIVIAPAGETKWVSLGKAEEIENKVRLYQRSTRGETDETALRQSIRALCEQVWAPIEAVLPAKTSNVIISPDGQLSFVSFATLLRPNDQFLGEKYSIRYVASGRDLLKTNKASTDPTTVVYANPDFGTTAQARAPNTADPALRDLEMRDLRGLSLQPLPGTESEAKALEERSGGRSIKTFLGAEATEEHLRGTNSPRILHLATHGFFLPEAASPNAPASTRAASETVKLRITNPMHRSGLALAGAQTTLDAWSRGEVPPAQNDGILTAEEVGALKLDGTWLVVLSACDTGSGEARAGEGVMGLRRGFVQAGAQNLLMTLWPISDQTTVQIMLDFYDAALRTNNAPQALADAQRDWLVKLRKEKGLLAAVRLAGPFIMSSQGKP
jgi:tetratricopeptide (TPR) repeat protein/CHAT domain-containing protein